MSLSWANSSAAMAMAETPPDAMELGCAIDGAARNHTVAWGG